MDELLKKLLLSDGISGFEQNAGTIIADALKKVCQEVSVDNLGNVYGKKGNGKKVIMLAAHMDEIGLMVKYITKEGFIYFVKIGGINDRILSGQKVEIINKNNERFVGIIGAKPPHLMNGDEARKPLSYTDMFIDIGMSSREEVLKHIEIGDQIIFSPSAGVLQGDLYYGKAADNRIGCFAMIKAMEKISKDLDATVYAVATAQEEVGLKGAKTASFKLNPDFAIAIDTTIAGDTPGIIEKESSLRLSKGAAITIIEASGRGTIVGRKVRELMFGAAKENKIPYQIDVIEGGMTDAATIYINREGILTGIISIPTRYIHSPVSVFSIKDVESAIDLCVKTVEKAAAVL